MDATFGNIKLSGASKRLLTRLACGDLNIPSFLTECAFWSIKDGFDELVPHPLPTAPVTSPAYREYASLEPDQKRRLDAQFFLKNPEIIEYFAQRNSVIMRNKATLGWLKEMKGYLPEDDLVLQGKIDDKIMKFILAGDA